MRACRYIAAVCSIVALALYVALPLGWLPMWLEPPGFLVEIVAAPVALLTGLVALFGRHWDGIAYLAVTGWICYQQFLSGSW
jgi:hypothetical protein